jgi:hypothetical protein
MTKTDKATEQTEEDVKRAERERIKKKLREGKIVSLEKLSDFLSRQDKAKTEPKK